MSHKTQLNGSARSPSVAGNMAEFGYDIMTLAELQLQLFKTDASTVLRSVLIPVAVVVFAIITLFASLPLLLMSGATALHTHGEVPLWAAQLSVGGGALLLSLLMSAFCIFLIQRQMRLFGRSREEFIRNVRWVKAVLKTGGGAPRRRAPHNSIS